MLKYVCLPLIAAVLTGCTGDSRTAADIAAHNAAAEKRIRELGYWTDSLQHIWKRRSKSRAATFYRYWLGKMVRRGYVELQCDVNKTEDQVPSWHPHLKEEWRTRVKEPLTELLRKIRRDPGVRELSDYVLLLCELEEQVLEGNMQEARFQLELAAANLQVPNNHPGYMLWKEATDLVPNADLPHLDSKVSEEWEDIDLQITEVGQGIKVGGRRYLVGDWINSSLKVVAIDKERVHFDYRGCRVSWPW